MNRKEIARTVAAITSFGAIDAGIIDGSEEASEEDYFISLQRAINSGSAWSMQGSMGRAMMDAIESGRCVLGRTAARDYWGNRIPSRDEVKRGTKGSLYFVAMRCGDEWSEQIAAV